MATVNNPIVLREMPICIDASGAAGVGTNFVATSNSIK